MVVVLGIQVQVVRKVKKHNKNQISIQQMWSVVQGLLLLHIQR